MSLLTISELEEKVEKAHKQLDGLLDDYRWIRNEATGQSRGSSAGGRTSIEWSDPTGSIATGKGKLKHLLRVIASKITSAVDHLEKAGKAVDDSEWQRKDAFSTKVGSFLRPGEEEESKAAKERREARGEGWGAG